MKYLDIHCHLNFDDFNTDRKDVIERAQREGVGMIVVGTDIKSSRKAIEIAEENEDIWATVGFHPTEKMENFDYETCRRLAENKKVVAIGECGFDYYRNSHINKSIQEEIFIKQINIANEVNKPLMLHLRNGIDGESAYDDAMVVIKKHSKTRGNVHFFAGNYDEAKKFLDLNFTLSFTGVITFVRDYDEIIKNIPLDMILTETDAPFVSPVPYRSKRNEPMYVKEIAHAIADIRKESREKVLSQIVNTAEKLFSL